MTIETEQRLSGEIAEKVAMPRRSERGIKRGEVGIDIKCFGRRNGVYTSSLRIS